MINLRVAAIFSLITKRSMTYNINSGDENNVKQTRTFGSAMIFQRKSIRKKPKQMTVASSEKEIK